MFSCINYFPTYSIKLLWRTLNTLNNLLYKTQGRWHLLNYFDKTKWLLLTKTTGLSHVLLSVSIHKIDIITYICWIYNIHISLRVFLHMYVFSCTKSTFNLIQSFYNTNHQRQLLMLQFFVMQLYFCNILF